MAGSLGPSDVRSLARSHTQTAIRTLANIAARGESETARVMAANSLLDRGWGKAEQRIEDKREVQVIVRHIIAGQTVDRPMIDVTNGTDERTT